MKIKEIIVVEGKDDTVAIQQAVHADTIETGGSALNKEKLERIRLAQERRGVIVFTDPDYPGERIRKLISQAVPGCKHAFLPRTKAVSKQGKYGVEHASPEDIRQALQAIKTEEVQETEEQISWLELQEYGLVGQATSQKLRARIGEELGIGYCNGKQFYKRLIAFCINYEEFEAAYHKAKQETSTDE
jgi:ribonuclease M5